jgi:periplasmic protein TonB
VAPKAPLRVGGRVKPPRILQQFDPLYPILARRALVQGDVVLSAIIDAQGNVTEMKLVSGHPLLIEAAMNALRIWKFEPTILDGEAVAISMDATIHFRLS